MRARHLIASFCIAVGGVLAQPASAQTYPTKPIRVLIPYSTGGATDVVARVVGAKVQESLGQPFVVESRTGAGGNIATEAVARAEPDGYTLLLATDGPIAVNPGLFAKLPFDIQKDLVPITLATSTGFVLLAAPNFPANSLRELISLAKANPGKYNFASLGLGSQAHLGGEKMNSMAGIRLVHVPYKGFGPAATDLMSGKVEILFGSMSSSVPLVKGGKVKALAVTTAERHPSLPDVPTMKESGLDYEMNVWFGFMAPAGTPQPVIAKLHEEITKALKSKDVVDRFAAQSMQVIGAGQADFGARIASDTAMWAQVIKESGAKAE